MKALLILLSITISTHVFAHGEDKYGPNKGFIRMPGTFHTELVPQMDGTFVVFLLDLQNKNPTIKDSSVQMELKTKKAQVTFNCKSMEDHFLCSNSKKIAITSESQIIIKAKRLGIQAKEAVYDMPLSLKGEKNGAEEMEKHDMHKM